VPWGRRDYIDWLRGIAVLIMIEAHVVDSWTGGADRQTVTFGRALIVGGMGGALFLFLAGVVVALSASAKLRRTGDENVAASQVVRRGFEIYLLAFLFRIQAWILGWSSPAALLKVDILNIMGPTIAAAGALWGIVHSTRSRLVAFTVVALALPLLTPLIAASPMAALPDPLEAYIRPIAGLSNFVFFPWAAFVFAGAIVGLALDSTPFETEGRANVWIFVTGAAIAAGAFAASYQPSPYPHSSFWHTSPCFFFLRAGLMTAAVGAAYAWQSRPGGVQKWSPLRQMGRSSLFIYWIHVEMVYGLISLPLHKALTVWQSFVMFALFSIFMLGCSIAKDRMSERVQKGFREGSGKVQKGFREGSGKVQKGFRKGSEKVQKGFRKGSEEVQKRFGIGSGKVPKGFQPGSEGVTTSSSTPPPDPRALRADLERRTRQSARPSARLEPPSG
jgi:uncharacterized membrane protein